MRLADPKKDKAVANKPEPETKWRRLFIKTDQYRFGDVIKALRKHGLRVLPENRIYKILDKIK